MAENKVCAKIKKDAAKKVGEIEKSFEEAAQELRAKHREGKKQFREQTRQMAKNEAERIHREILTEARLKARKMLLATKHRMIKKALDEAAHNLRKSKKYPKLLADVVKEGGKDSKVLLSANDAKRLAKKSWAKNAQKAEIKGGVILRSPKKDINYSLDAAYEALGQELTLELAEIMFSDSASKGKAKPSNDED